MPTRLESLATSSTIVADTGEIDLIERFRPEDCTTNPSLLLKASRCGDYDALVDDAIAWGRGQPGSVDDRLEQIMNRLAVNFGTRLTQLVPGRVSTEVDAALSFDTEATIARAEALIGLYDELGVGRERVLIKIAATWEGIQAARHLQRSGIDCNMTLIFSKVQAVASAEAGAFLISPFVGRITDWYRNAEGRDYPANEDPGVLSVREIWEYFKSHDLKTVVMAASFRTRGQIEALAGCDRLTIAPTLLDELAANAGDVPRQLDVTKASTKAIATVDVSEPAFRWQLNQDPMATEKLAEGIRRFHEDGMALRQSLRERF